VHNAFAAALKESGIKKKVRPHGMRYLFNDLLRLAGVDSVSARSLTGHVTEQMREHYSTVRLDKKRAVMARVGERLRERSGDSSGDSTEKQKGRQEEGALETA
jgi:integrase